MNQRVLGPLGADMFIAHDYDWKHKFFRAKCAPLRAKSLRVDRYVYKHYVPAGL